MKALKERENKIEDALEQAGKAREEMKQLKFSNEQLLMEAKEDFKTPPLIAEWLPMSNVLYPILQKIILGDAEPQKGLDDAATQVRDLMAKAGYYK